MKIKVQRKGKKKIEVLTHRCGGGHNRNQRSTERPVGVHLSLSLPLSLFYLCVVSVSDPMVFYIEFNYFLSYLFVSYDLFLLTYAILSHNMVYLW